LALFHQIIRDLQREFAELKARPNRKFSALPKLLSSDAPSVERPPPTRRAPQSNAFGRVPHKLHRHDVVPSGVKKNLATALNLAILAGAPFETVARSGWAFARYPTRSRILHERFEGIMNPDWRWPCIENSVFELETVMPDPKVEKAKKADLQKLDKAQKKLAEIKKKVDEAMKRSGK
jgi:hypothetical protein